MATRKAESKSKVEKTILTNVILEMLHFIYIIFKYFLMNQTNLMGQTSFPDSFEAYVCSTTDIRVMCIAMYMSYCRRSYFSTK